MTVICVTQHQLLLRASWALRCMLQNSDVRRPYQCVDVAELLDAFCLHTRCKLGSTLQQLAAAAACPAEVSHQPAADSSAGHTSQQDN
jgi:hypothetical protein